MFVYKQTEAELKAQDVHLANAHAAELQAEQLVEVERTKQSAQLQVLQELKVKEAEAASVAEASRARAAQAALEIEQEQTKQAAAAAAAEEARIKLVEVQAEAERSNLREKARLAALQAEADSQHKKAAREEEDRLARERNSELVRYVPVETLMTNGTPVGRAVANRIDDIWHLLLLCFHQVARGKRPAASPSTSSIRRQ